VSPERTESNRRLYSEADIERLLMLKRATQIGFSIKQAAEMPAGELVALLEENGNLEKVGVEAREASVIPYSSLGKQAARKYTESIVKAIRDLDNRSLEEVLRRAAIALSRTELIESVISPVLRELGDRWRSGSLRIGHEHLATAVLRTFMGNLIATCPVPDSAPGMIVTTPAGQIHELGALAVALVAQDEGFRAIYLGPNLPAEEIAAAALHHEARAVAISIVHPPDDPRLGSELRRLRTYLPQEVELFAGGQAAPAYSEVLKDVGAAMIHSITGFRTRLEALRARGLELAN
jgi:methanogenic corrinoid protein MtbC1